jgi:hypothetical protein
MAIVYKLPEKARHIPTNNTFVAAFGTPTFGYYDFNIPGNQDQNVLELQPSTAYFIDYFQLAGNIASEDFLSVITIQPAMLFKKSISKEVVFTAAIPISVFAAQIYVSTFVHSQKLDEFLTASFTGSLAQNANLVGVSPIKINLKLAAYAMDEKSYGLMMAGREFHK